MKTAKQHFQAFLNEVLPTDPYSFPDIYRVIELLKSNPEVLDIKYEIAIEVMLTKKNKKYWHDASTPELITKTVLEYGADGPDGDRLTITTLRGSDFAESLEYRMALAIMHIYAEHAGCTIIGNLNQSVTWNETHCYYVLEVPYIHYGS